MGTKIDRIELGWRRGALVGWLTVSRISGSMLEKIGIPHIDVFPLATHVRIACSRSAALSPCSEPLLAQPPRDCSARIQRGQRKGPAAGAGRLRPGLSD
jgi:hypothetical protein